jgi:hypothetical protein
MYAQQDSQLLRVQIPERHLGELTAPSSTTMQLTGLGSTDGERKHAGKDQQTHFHKHLPCSEIFEGGIIP